MEMYAKAMNTHPKGLMRLFMIWLQRETNLHRLGWDGKIFQTQTRKDGTKLYMYADA
jgi:hypothetical protein